jgi:N-acetylmuramoyl-L-alanine amidase
MPSILLELGYITNPEDRRHLQSEKFLTRMASGLVRGIVQYRDKMKQYATFTPE